MSPSCQPQHRDESESSNDAQYRSYLLRLWRPSAEAPWRASLEDIATGERTRFPDLESLILHLLGIIGRDADSATHRGESERPET